MNTYDIEVNFTYTDKDNHVKNIHYKRNVICETVSGGIAVIVTHLLEKFGDGYVCGVEAKAVMDKSLGEHGKNGVSHNSWCKLKKDAEIEALKIEIVELKEQLNFKKGYWKGIIKKLTLKR